MREEDTWRSLYESVRLLPCTSWKVTAVARGRRVLASRIRACTRVIAADRLKSRTASAFS